MLISRINDLQMLSSCCKVDFTKKGKEKSFRFEFFMRLIIIGSFGIEVCLTALDLILTELEENTTKISDN
jgi:hypothetical protein